VTKERSLVSAPLCRLTASLAAWDDNCRTSLPPPSPYNCDLSAEQAPQLSTEIAATALTLRMCCV